MTDVRDRKAEQLQIASSDGIEHAKGTGLDAVRLRHRALPERDLASVSLRTRFLNADLAAPLIVSSMTGGTPAAQAVNLELARAAAATGVAMGLGSGRPLLDDPGLAGSYIGSVRPPLVLANLGAVQLRGPAGPDAAERVVTVLGADGLYVHLNPLQEAVQPEGETCWSGIVEAIAAVVERLAPLPVIVKEVGFGLDPEDIRLLASARVAAIDVAGGGGTNWALIEGRREGGVPTVAAAFADWGLPTARAVQVAAAVRPALGIVASGGLWTGVDVAKCLALGATIGGMARPLLRAALEHRATEALEAIVAQLRIATWLAGAGSSAELAPEHLCDDET